MYNNLYKGGGTVSVKFSASQMVSVTELLRNFGEVAEKIGEEDLIIVRNNKPDFVLMNFSEYEKLRELDELVEHIEIWNMVEERKNNRILPGGEVIRKIGLSAEDWEEVCSGEG